MGLLRKLFGTRDPPPTALQAVLSALTLDQAQKTYQSVGDPRLRLPAAISVITLFAAHKFVLGYMRMIRDTSKAAQVAALAVPYDPIAFEAAAYCHYWLMKDGFDIDEEGRDEKGNETDDTYFAFLRDAAFVTDSMIQRHASFSLPRDFFMNRMGSYARSGAHSATAHERFLGVLLSAQMRGSPGPIQKQSSTSLPGELAAISYVGIFHKSYLDALPKTVESLYEAHRNGNL